MKELTFDDIELFRKRAKVELKSGCDVGRLRWDDVVEALCKEVIRLKIQCREILTSGYLRVEMPNNPNYKGPTIVEMSSAPSLSC